MRSARTPLTPFFTSLTSLIYSDSGSPTAGPSTPRADNSAGGLAFRVAFLHQKLSAMLKETQGEKAYAHPFSKEEKLQFSSILGSLEEFLVHQDFAQKDFLEIPSSSAPLESSIGDALATKEKESGETFLTLFSGLPHIESLSEAELAELASEEERLNKTEWSSIPSEERKNALKYFQEGFSISSKKLEEWILNPALRLQSEIPKELRRQHEALHEIFRFLSTVVANTTEQKILFGSLCAIDIITNTTNNISQAILGGKEGFSPLAARVIAEILSKTIRQYIFGRLLWSVEKRLDEMCFDTLVKHEYSGYGHIISGRGNIIRLKHLEKIISLFLDCVAKTPSLVINLGKTAAQIKDAPAYIVVKPPSLVSKLGKMTSNTTDSPDADSNDSPEFAFPAPALAAALEAIPSLPIKTLPQLGMSEFLRLSDAMQVVDTYKIQIAGWNAVESIQEAQKREPESLVSTFRKIYQPNILQQRLLAFARTSISWMRPYYSGRELAKELYQSRLPAAINESDQLMTYQDYIAALNDILAFSSSAQALSVSYSNDQDKKICFKGFTYCAPDDQPFSINPLTLMPEVPLSVRVPRQLEKAHPPYDFDIPVGKKACVQVVGPNGNGKTMLLIALLGGVTFAEGSITVPYHRDEIIFFAADPYIDFKMSLRENVFWPYDESGSKSTEEEDNFLYPLLETLGLMRRFGGFTDNEKKDQKKVDLPLVKLSSGEEKIVAWLRLFAHLARAEEKGNPIQLLILDESTSYISKENIGKLNTILTKMAPDIAVLAINHCAMFREVTDVVRVEEFKASLLSKEEGLEELEKLKDRA